MWHYHEIRVRGIWVTASKWSHTQIISDIMTTRTFRKSGVFYFIFYFQLKRHSLVTPMYISQLNNVASLLTILWFLWIFIALLLWLSAFIQLARNAKLKISLTFLLPWFWFCNAIGRGFTPRLGSFDKVYIVPRFFYRIRLDYYPGCQRFSKRRAVKRR